MIKELEEARRARLEKERIWLEYQALLPTPQAQKTDGMPRSGFNGDQNARLVDLRNEMEEMYKQAAERFVVAEKAARAKMAALTPWLYSLCLFYYINAMKEKEVCEVMRISDSTFKRYKADLKKYEPQ